MNKEMIEAYNPSEEEALDWSAERDDFIQRTFSELTRPSETLSPGIPRKKVPPIKAG
jgi:hypothetical protein